MIETMIDDLGLEDFVTFAGYRSDVSACMKAMDLLVHPSLSESFGQVLVEAMNVEPLLSARRWEVCRKLFQTGKPGGWFQLETPVRSQMRYWTIRDQAVRERLGRAGQLSVRESFTVDRMVARHSDLYRCLLDRNSAGSNNHVGS